MSKDKPNKIKVTFAPLPARAISDQRLTGLHFRVLAVICLHDRMSGALGKGQGCWASHRTLAQKCDCNYSNLSTAMKQLAHWGYIEAAPHPMDKRRRVYRALYTDDDFLAVSTGNSLPDDKQSASKGGEIVCPDFHESVSNQRVDSAKYIPRSGEDITLSVERYSVETAPLCSSDVFDAHENTAVATYLRKTEAMLRAGDLTEQRLAEIRKILTTIEEAHEYGSPLFHWAQRLLDTIELEA